jgi:hypothetical protein
MFSNKDKNIKKRKSLRKRKTEEDKLNEYSGEEIKEEGSNNNYNSPSVYDIPDKDMIHCLDVGIHNNIEIQGRKGHSNHYSKQNISQGTYYFEATILSTDFNINEFINSKRNDEFSKKYYESLL